MEKRETLTKMHDVFNQLISEQNVPDAYVHSLLPEHVELSSISHVARKMLDILSQAGMEMNQRTLAKHVGVSPQAISVHVKKMEARGFLTKTSGGQKNENLLVLTERGHQLGTALNGAVEHHAEHVLKGLSEEENAQLLELLCKIQPYWVPTN